MTRSLSWVCLLLLPLFAFAQNVHEVSFAKNEPFIYQDSAGKYEGCGMRSTFLTKIPKHEYAADFSIGLFKERDGKLTGLTKMIFSAIPDLSNPEKFQNLALTNYMMADSNGIAITLSYFRAGKEKNSMLATTYPLEVINILGDIQSGKSIQVGVSIKGEQNMIMFAAKPEKQLTKDEMLPLITCISKLFPSNIR